MIEHTHNLIQYAVPRGKYCDLYKRPKPVGKQKYTAPRFIGIQYCGSKAKALEFKASYDKPIMH